MPLALILLAAVANGAPSPSASGTRLDVPYEIFRLKNGLTVVVHEDHSAPIASVNAWYHVGSAREKPGRTGFAHLFEHIMFEGSQNVPEGAFDRWLEALGGSNNGSTTTDRTNYWENVPANAVEMALFLEADRMGFLLPVLTPKTVDGQRDVVKNERRQSYENRPYGMAELALLDALYPPDHPYHWPTIGSMEDLTAATHQDVAEFFEKWYGPNNTSLVIAGDVEPARMRAMVEKWFGDIPARAPVEPLAPRPVLLTAEKRLVMEDQVQLPRLYLQWPTPPAYSGPEASLDALAEVLAGGKNSRLYKRLVYELEAAQDVSCYQESQALASTFNVVVTARAGHDLREMAKLVDEELDRLRAEAPSERELLRFQNQLEARVYDRLERVGGFGGKADQMNQYLFYTGNPDFFEEDLARYRALSPADVRAAALHFLTPERIVLSVVPRGHRELAVPEAGR
jgi:zinc protease